MMPSRSSIRTPASRVGPAAVCSSRYATVAIPWPDRVLTVQQDERDHGHPGQQACAHGRTCRVGDQDPGPAVRQLVAEELTAQVPVERHGDRAEPGAGKQHLDGLEPVTAQQGDRITLRHAERGQSGRDPVGAIRQFSVAAPAIGPHLEIGLAGALAGQSAQQRPDGLARLRDDGSALGRLAVADRPPEHEADPRARHHQHVVLVVATVLEPHDAGIVA